MHLLELPPELREEIYRPILDPLNYRHTDSDNYTTYNYRPALSSLLRINRQIYHEARRTFLEQNTFIVIETSWPEAHQHVAMEGHVPILTTGSGADNFRDHSLLVQIKPPPDPFFLNRPPNRFVIHVDDLPTFTETWRYSDLDLPQLNAHLSLHLQLRDPRTRADWDEPKLSKALQRRLLLPFGIVKNLADVKVTGTPPPFESLVAEVRAEQLIPHESPDSCLRRCDKLKNEGNVCLQKGLYKETLELYKQAWVAMHVVVSGRSRHVHGDPWFHRELREEPWKGQQGQMVRLQMRVKLVANTVLVYYKMGEYQEAIYWGMRTINIVRNNLGLRDGEEADNPQDEAVMNFGSGAEMGKIYYRTGIAWRELDDKFEARKLLKVAHCYLPRDELVAKALAECSPRLG